MTKSLRCRLVLVLLALYMALAVPTLQAAEKVGEPAKHKVTAVKQVKSASLPPAMIKTFHELEVLRSLVIVKGGEMRPRAGNSLWQLSNGGFAILGFEPTASAMETWTKDVGLGYISWITCYCKGKDPDKDDGCRFENVSDPNNPGKCQGPACCGTVDGLIEPDGTPVIFPPANK
jgi:hypothetical protein